MLPPSSAWGNYNQVGALVIWGSKWVNYINRLHGLSPIRNMKRGEERDLVPGQQEEWNGEAEHQHNEGPFSGPHTKQNGLSLCGPSKTADTRVYGSPCRTRPRLMGTFPSWILISTEDHMASSMQPTYKPFSESFQHLCGRNSVTLKTINSCHESLKN